MKKASRTITSILFTCILGGVTVLTVTLILPPAPLPVDTPATEFSAPACRRNDRLTFLPRLVAPAGAWGDAGSGGVLPGRP
jgi:hypothetical protein